MKIFVSKKSFLNFHGKPTVKINYDEENDGFLHQWYVPCSVEIESVEEEVGPTGLVQRLSEIEGEIEIYLHLGATEERFTYLEILDNDHVISKIFDSVQVTPNTRTAQMTAEIELQDELIVTFNDCAWTKTGGFTFKEISYKAAWTLLTTKPEVVKVSVYLNLLQNGDPTEAEVRVVNRKILKDSVHTDFSIVTKEDVIIACHKCHLTVASSVLKREIEGSFKEGQAGKIHMDYHTETVEALLDYIYFRSLAVPKKSCLIAFELFKASDYYHISALWYDVVKIFQEMDSKWFDLKVALEFFGFILKYDNLDIAKHLGNKMVEVVASQNDGLEKFNFHQVFKDDPSALNAWIMYSCSYIFPKQKTALEESQ